MKKAEYEKYRALIDVADSQFGDMPDGAYWAACAEMGVGTDIQIAVDEYEQSHNLGVHTVAKPTPAGTDELDNMLIEVRHGRMSNTKAKAAIQSLIARQVTAARMDELNNIQRWEKAQKVISPSLITIYDERFVPLVNIEKRLAELRNGATE